HESQRSSWLPPTENWDPGPMALPYGWECGVDKKNNRPYFINHIERFTSQDDPRDDPDYVEPPKPREIELTRDPQKGFGFVAGSEKPVVVRFVTDGGPSVDRLLPGDQIIKINGEDVKKAPREYVIDLVRSCKQAITLTVCQPYSDNSTKKSSLLTAAKKARLKNNPNRVRFAENVTVTMVNGAPLQSPSTHESYVPFMPNVLKVFLENGQTKSFKYDNKTTVKDVVQSLVEKLNIHCVKHFNLVLQNTKSSQPGRMTLLQEQETLAEIAARPGARHFRCLFRVMYVPYDPYDLLKEDPVAFEYFYMQCCNDIVQERFPELKGDTIFKLAALHIQQHAISNNNSSKVNLKAIQKDCGLEKFLPESILENMKIKDVRKMLTHQLKVNQNLTPPGQKNLSSLQAKLHYMKIVSELKTFGSRVFMVTMLDKKAEAMVLVGPKSGIGLITNIKQYTISVMAEFDQITSVKVTKEKDNMQKVEIIVDKNDGDEATLNFGLLKDDAMNFVGMIEGYYKIFVDADKILVEKPASKQSADPDVPPYLGKHRVIVAPWSYPEDIVSTVIQSPLESEEEEVLENERIVNLCAGPPSYDGNSGEYIARIKHDLGIKSDIEGEKDDDSVETITSLTNLHTDEKSVNDVAPPQKSIIVIGSPKMTSDSVNKIPSKRSGNSDLDGIDRKAPHRENGEIVTNDYTERETEKYMEDFKEVIVNKFEELSDTDSGVESERKIPLEDLAPGSKGHDPESDDSDSWGTPSNSPAKGRKFGNIPSFGVEFYSESFGLHSPDQLPRTESDFEVIASSFGLLSPEKIPPEVEEGILDPRMFSERRLYIDPDIIDLTLMPPPPPHDPPMLNASPSWHPEVQHTSSLPTAPAASHDNGASAHHPPFDRSASVGDNPDFFDSDIDELIAKLTIPPPPGDNVDTFDSSIPLSQTWSGPLNNDDINSGLDDSLTSLTDLDKTVDDIFASLIIPPPPGEASEELETVPIVPPVSAVSETNSVRRHEHRRSSSVDLSLLKTTSDTSSDSKSKNSSIEVDRTQNIGDTSNTDEVKSSTSGSKKRDSKTEFDTPASVSEKLSNLLQMIPNFSNVDEGIKIFRRTSSLRLNKASSLELAPVPCDLKDAAQKTGPFRAKAASFDNILDTKSEDKENIEHKRKEEESKVGSKYSRHLRRTNSFDFTQHNLVKEDPEVKQVTESFSALKSKLQSYRDFLLKKSNSTKKERNTERTSYGDSDTEQSKSPLKRSNSFTFSFLKRRSSSSDSDETSDRSKISESLQALKSRKEKKSSSQKKKQSGESADKEKRTPALLNTLATTRTFRPPSSSSTQKVGGKKSGPMRALSNVLSSSEGNLLDDSPKRERAPISNGPIKPVHAETKTDTNTDESPKRRSSITSGEETRDRSFTSKDDISLTNSEKSKKKENPFGTVNNMWRPISMSKSSSIRKDDTEESYRVYNNFDALRDISAGKAPPVREVKVPVITKKTKSAPLPSESVQKKNGSISGVSFAVLKDKIHESHSDCVKEILQKEYKVDSFASATKDSDRLLAELKHTMETLKDSRIDRQSSQFGMCKDELTNQVMVFVKDAKLLVSNATQTKEKMASNLNGSMHTLARIFLHSQATMIMMEATHQAQHLGFEVIKLTNAFKSTINAAQAAVGKPLGDPHMKYLMRQATNLAQLISSLLKSLKTLQQK
ncbi:hypothetical protein FSP39_005085, partial [Pinctada imbricata]